MEIGMCRIDEASSVMQRWWIVTSRKRKRSQCRTKLGLVAGSTCQSKLVELAAVQQSGGLSLTIVQVQGAAKLSTYINAI